MKRTSLLLLIVMALLLSACAAAADPADPTDPGDGAWIIRVAPYGDDAADGVSKPVATVSRALALAGEKISAADVTIEIADGIYRVTEPISITHAQTDRESGHVLTLLGGKNSVISGGKAVTGWEKQEGNIWKADLSGFGTVGGFYVDGENMTLARLQIRGKFADTDGQGGIILENKERYTNFASYNTLARIVKCAFTTREDYDLDFEALREELPHVRMYFDQTFTRTCFEFDTVTESGGSYTFTASEATLNTLNKAKMADYSSGSNRYYLVNSYLFLDEEGEYYYDKDTGTLYYYSENSPADRDCVAAVSEGLLNIQGIPSKLASNLRIQNLTFAYGTSRILTENPFKELQSDSYLVGLTEGETDYERFLLPAQITVDRASNITIENCSFLNLDTSGIALREYVYNAAITGNRIRNVSGSGIVVGTIHPGTGYGLADQNPHPEDLENVYAVRKNSVIPALLTIRDNVIENCGIESIGSNGILLHYGYRADIRNNTVRRTGGSGISVGWGWGNWSVKKSCTKNTGSITVEGNRIESPCMRVDDAGGIYTLGAFFGDGLVLRGNFLDMNGAANSAMPAIYLDEGSEWVSATGNVSVGTKMWLWARALPLKSQGGKYVAGSPDSSTIMNSSVSGNFSETENQQKLYTSGNPWPYASEVSGANVIIENNIADGSWMENETVMAIIQAAGAAE